MIKHLKQGHFLLETKSKLAISNFKYQGAIIGLAVNLLFRGSLPTKFVPCSNQLFGAAAPQRV